MVSPLVFAGASGNDSRPKLGSGLYSARSLWDHSIVPGIGQDRISPQSLTTSPRLGE